MKLCALVLYISMLGSVMTSQWHLPMGIQIGFRTSAFPIISVYLVRVLLEDVVLQVQVKPIFRGLVKHTLG